MRLGERLSKIILPGTKVERLYKKKKIYERHRHRYEINPLYLKELKN